MGQRPSFSESLAATVFEPEDTPLVWSISLVVYLLEEADRVPGRQAASCCHQYALNAASAAVDNILAGR
jgi:hypothetical protein